MEDAKLVAVFDACRILIQGRFEDDADHGAAAVLLDDGRILTGTAPEALNPAVEVCHEVEPYCAAFRLGRQIVASACLHREAGGATLVLSPCGVCRERLAVHGPEVLVAVADVDDPAVAVWKPLRSLLPDYWLSAFSGQLDPAWTSPDDSSG